MRVKCTHPKITNDRMLISLPFDLVLDHYDFICQEGNAADFQQNANYFPYGNTPTQNN